MSSYPIITKHCREIDKNRMLDGHFKFGSLSEFRAYESKIGTLSDKWEGVSEAIFDRDVENFTGSVDGNWFENCTIRRGAISFKSEVEAAVFCSSVGSYDEVRHRRLVEGSGEYPSNPELTHYLEISGSKFAEALALLFHRLDFDIGLAGGVAYGGRNYTFAPTPNGNSIEGGWAQLFNMALFSKPTVFSVEEEYRFALARDDHFSPVESIYTKDHGDEVCSLFRAAVIGIGKV